MTRFRVLWATLGVFAFGVIAITELSAAALYTQPFEPWRRAQAEALLNDALELDTKVDGAVEVSFGLTPKVVISEVSSARTNAISDLKSVSAKKLDFNVSLLSLMSGDAALTSLFVDGLKVDIELPEGGTDRKSDDPAALIHDFVRMLFSSNLSLQNFQLSYQDRETGWNAQYVFDRFGIYRRAGAVLVKGVGHIHDRPLKLTGKIEPSGGGGNQHTFSFSAKQSGLAVEFSGVYRTAVPADTINASLRAHSGSLADLVDVYDVRHSIDGKGDLTFSLSGPLGTTGIGAGEHNPLALRCHQLFETFPSPKETRLGGLDRITGGPCMARGPEWGPELDSSTGRASCSGACAAVIIANKDYHYTGSVGTEKK